MKKFWNIGLIFVFTLLFYLPILLNPNVLVNRGNDLTEFFFPIFYFTKESILKYHQLPFWNNLFFSGTPLLPDPQAPLFYIPNIIFIFFKNIDLGFLISVFLHIFTAGVGMYLLAKKSFKFSNLTSLFLAFIYIASPKLSGFIEAGHYGLIASWTWLPFVLLFTKLLLKKPTFKKSIILAFFLSLIFYTHVLIFMITVILVFFVLLRKPKYLIFIGLLCFGLVAVSFLPQLTWQNQTTRNLLLKNPETYPIWNSKVEFIKSAISPILFGPKFIQDLDTEKVISVGLLTFVLSCVGFWKSPRNQKLPLLFVTFIVLLLSLNNLSPFYPILIKQNWFILFRVSTRFWFIITFIAIYLAGVGMETLLKIKKLKFFSYSIILLTILELLLTSWTKILKPIVKNQSLVPTEVYKWLSYDKSQFRVFCLERCLSQKEASLYHLELADGYGTLQQQNYYVESEQLSQAFYRDRYTLSIPPFEIYKYENLQPYSPNLASYNVKYIISNHSLTDKNLKLVKIIASFQIYENTINLPRSNYPITFYSPNTIDIDTSDFKSSPVVLSEVYNNDWKALSNIGSLPIKETSDKTRSVEISNKVKYVNFSYDPVSFKIGLAVTFVTILICLKSLLF